MLILIIASLDAVVPSSSLLLRRHRPIHENVRSTIHRLDNTIHPLTLTGRRTV
jgi:hypothetical protein